MKLRIGTMILILSCASLGGLCFSQHDATEMDLTDTIANALNIQDFTAEVNGKGVSLYRLENGQGAAVLVTNYGARIVQILVPDKQGSMADVVLGFPTLEGYMSEFDQSFGAVVGRYANRIGNASFELEGTRYILDANNGKNTLHSGKSSWKNRVWDVISSSDGHLTLGLTSPDGDGGFPGEVYATVTYTFDEENTLRIVFNAESDVTTIINMTSHSYFNLAGGCSGSIVDHKIIVNADAVTEIGEGLIPTGGLTSVAGSPLDLRSEVLLDDVLNDHDPVFALTHGYDHNYVLNKSVVDPAGLSFAAKISEAKTGRKLEVWTSQPGIQCYTGNWLNENVVGKCGEPFHRRGGVCLETQHFPDSPNHPSFPTTTITPKEPYREVVEYRFGLIKE